MTTWQTILIIISIILIIDILALIFDEEIRKSYSYFFEFKSLFRDSPFYLIPVFVLISIPLLGIGYVLSLIVIPWRFVINTCHKRGYYFTEKGRADYEWEIEYERQRKEEEPHLKELSELKERLESKVEEYNHYQLYKDQGKIKFSVIPLDVYPSASYGEVIVLDFTEDSAIDSLINRRSDTFEKLIEIFSEEGSLKVVSKQHPLIIPRESISYYLPEVAENELEKYSFSNYDVLTTLGYSLSDILGQGAVIHLKHKISSKELGYRPEDVNGYYFKYNLGSLSELKDVKLGDEILDFTLSPLFLKEDEDFIRDFYSILRILRPDSGLCFSLKQIEENEEYADNLFQRSEMLQTVADEIRERVEKLRTHGVSEAAIISLVGSSSPKLSHIRITKDFKIFLSDYGNREIVLSPLHKALYLLYLKHPEGILFKELQDYMSELRDLYLSISDRSDITKLDNSIKALCDSTTNSINEKCSRIRAAFLLEFSERIVDNYVIKGKAKEKKRIPIASRPDMIIWE